MLDIRKLKELIRLMVENELTEIDLKLQAIFENRYGMIGRFAPRRLKDGIDSLTAIDLRVGVQNDSFRPDFCLQNGRDGIEPPPDGQRGWLDDQVVGKSINDQSTDAVRFAVH